MSYKSFQIGIEGQIETVRVDPNEAGIERLEYVELDVTISINEKNPITSWVKTTGEDGRDQIEHPYQKMFRFCGPFTEVKAVPYGRVSNWQISKLEEQLQDYLLMVLAHFRSRSGMPGANFRQELLTKDYANETGKLTRKLWKWLEEQIEPTTDQDIES